MKIWLDDLRPAPQGRIWCKSFNDLWIYLTDDWDQIEEISFDHDLGGYEDGSKLKSGSEITKWILEQAHYQYRWRKHRWVWEIHSANPVGRVAMESDLKQLDKIWDENVSH